MGRSMPATGHVELCQFANPDALACSVAGRWLGTALQEFRYVALSGGRIARHFLAAAAGVADADPRAARMIGQTHYFWVDERCVPPDHHESNYRLAKEALFDRHPPPDRLVHRLQGELVPALAVQNANRVIRLIVPHGSAGVPVFDLVILGMGEDGHIASLFPGGTAGGESAESPYAVVVGPKPPNLRLTLTYRVLAAAKEAWVLVAGDNKELPLRKSLEGKCLTPLAQLLNLRESTRVFVDRFF